ncbi:MAG TPA: hypothetical protein VEW46_19450 [Pyrinomonadaceae bacterium]|nr:hypothetical protein [Pyrinomonadaceae bacterium]
MRFLLGLLVGYSMRGKKKLLMTVLATVAFIVYMILPAIALLAPIWTYNMSASRGQLKPGSILDQLEQQRPETDRFNDGSSPTVLRYHSGREPTTQEFDLLDNQERLTAPIGASVEGVPHVLEI